MARKDETFYNLIDQCIEYEIDSELSGKPKEMFRKILVDYFFRDGCSENKSLEQFFERFELPGFLDSYNSLLDIDIAEFSAYVNGDTINDSMSGQIILSKTFLRYSYPGQDPVFANLSEDVKFEVVDRIKEMNEKIISAFEKMMSDRDADRKRKVITLISLILKNIHQKTGRPLNRLSEPANEIIKSMFPDADEKFTGNQRQLANLNDDTKIKELIKAFFMIKQYKDIEEVSELYKVELERFKKRSLRAAG